MNLSFLPTDLLLFGLPFSAILLLTAVSDINKRIIPDIYPALIAMLSLARVAFILLSITPDISCVVKDRLSGLLAAPLPFLIISLIKLGAFGGGDIKLLGACGMFLGLKQSIVCVAVAIISSGVWILAAFFISAAPALFSARKAERKFFSKAEIAKHNTPKLKESIPFAPFIALGAAVAYFLVSAG